MLADFFVIGLLLVMAGLLVVALVTGWFTRQRRFGIASLTVWHDWQPSDKQHGTEIVIEQRAGKRLAAGGNEEEEKP